MAIRTLAAETLSITSMTTIFTAGIGNTATISSAVLCNLSSSIIDVEVYISSPTEDTLVTTARLPGGSGKSVLVRELIGGINSQWSIKVKPSQTTQVNVVIYGNTVNA